MTEAERSQGELNAMAAHIATNMLKAYHETGKNLTEMGVDPEHVKSQALILVLAQQIAGIIAAIGCVHPELRETFLKQMKGEAK